MKRILYTASIVYLFMFLPNDVIAQPGNPCQPCLDQFLQDMLGSQVNNQGFSWNKLLFFHIGPNNNSTNQTGTFENNYGNELNHANNWAASPSNNLGLSVPDILLYIAQYQACRAANGCN